MNFKSFLLLITCLFAGLIEAQESMELKKKNGFRNIELSARVDYYVYANNISMFRKIDSSAAKPFVGFGDFDYKYIKPDHDVLGDADIVGTYVKTVNKKIYQISVFTERDESLFELLETAFGKPVAQLGMNEPNAKVKLMSWKGGDIYCKLYAIEGNPYYELRYYSFTLSEEAEALRKANLNPSSEQKKQKALKQF